MISSAFYRHSYLSPKNKPGINYQVKHRLRSRRDKVVSTPYVQYKRNLRCVVFLLGIIHRRLSQPGSRLEAESIDTYWSQFINQTVMEKSFSTELNIWVPANCKKNITEYWGQPKHGFASHSGVGGDGGGVIMPLLASWLSNRN